MRLDVCEVAGGGGSIVALGGEVGFSEVQELKSRLDRVLKGQGGGLVIDLGEMSFIASDGLGVLIRTRAHAEQAGKVFILARPQPRILDLMKKTKLTDIFTICDSLEEGLAELKSA